MVSERLVLFIMKKIFNFIIIFVLFSTNIYAADEIEKGKTLLKSLSKKSLTKKETTSFLKKYAIILEDERSDGEVTYVFDDENYSRYKDIEVISTDAWRFSKLGVMRLFNKDIKMSWKIKISDKENLINIKTKFDPFGKLYKFTVMDKKDFLDQIEQIKLAEKQKKEIAKKAKIEKKKKQEKERLAAENKLEEEKQKLEEEKKKLTEEKLALQEELEKQKIEFDKQKKKTEEELLEAKKTPEQKQKEELEKKKAEKLAEKKRLKEENDRKKAEKLAEKKRLKEENDRKKAEQATKELYNSVLNSKWGMKNIPCNYNGGAYTEFILGKGEIFTAGGKKQEGGGISNMSGTLKQISPNQFTMKQILTPTPGNRLVYSAIGNRPSAVVFKTYTIINRDLIKFKSEIKMIDVDAILKGYKGNQVGYTYRTEYGERVRCK